MDFFSKLNQEFSNNFFSGSQWFVFQNGLKKENGFLGFLTENKKIKVSEDSFFDLASLTKPLFTVALFYFLFSKNELKTENKVSDFFEFKRDISLLQLLNHSSGLPAYLPFFKLIKTSQNKKKTVLQLIEKTNKVSTKIYSDLNFILLGFILEKVFDKDLKAVFEEFLLETKIQTKINFANPPLSKKDCVATMFSEVRNRIVQGEVEDENAFFLGKEVGHAGLFGSAKDVANYLNQLFEQDWFVDFLTAFNGLGFDRAEGENSNYGKNAKFENLGHLGFTGTAFSFDLKQKKTAVFLTNRTHPTPNKPNSKQRIKLLRQLFFDTFFN